MKNRMCLATVSFLFAALCFPFHIGTLVAQINIDSIAIPHDTLNQDVDSVRLQLAIDLVSKGATPQGLTGTVVIPAGNLIRDPRSGKQKYVPRHYYLNQPISIPGNVLLISDSPGRRGSRLTWVDGIKDGDALLNFHGGFGGGINGLEIGVSPNLSEIKGIIGLRMESQSSAVFQNFTVNFQFAGPDSIGILVAQSNKKRNTESVTARDFNVIADRPVIFAAGDNLVFSHFDLTCHEKVTAGNIKAVFQNKNGYVPANLVIGPGSGQKGDHAVCFTGRRERNRGTGDEMTIQNFRWEQGTTLGPAWWIDIFRFAKDRPLQRLHAFESLVMINCRNAPLGHKNPDYVSRKIPAAGVVKTEFIGGFLPGKYQKD